MMGFIVISFVRARDIIGSSASRAEWPGPGRITATFRIAAESV